MKAISLFSGMGGDTLGMEMAGIDAQLQEQLLEQVALKLDYN